MPTLISAEPGIGEVYSAKNTQLNRQVAFKLVPADFVAEEGCVSRFGHEARAQLELKGGKPR